MAVGDVNPSSFEFYEGVRIVVPGALVVSLYGGVVATFDLAAPEPQAKTLFALVAALLSGLFLYYLDLPARSAVFNTRLPHELLDSWQRPHGVSARNLFFAMLDEDFPPTVRNRALYYGSIFRIGYEAIYLLLGSSVIVLAAATLIGEHGSHRSSASPNQGLLVAAYIYGGLAVWAVLNGYVRLRSRHCRLGSLQALGVSLSRQIPLADRLVLALSVVAGFGWLPFRVPWVTLLLAVGGPLLLWGFRYYRGVPEKHLPQLGAILSGASPLRSTSGK